MRQAAQGAFRKGVKHCLRMVRNVHSGCARIAAFMPWHHAAVLVSSLHMPRVVFCCAVELRRVAAALQSAPVDASAELLAVPKDLSKVVPRPLRKSIYIRPLYRKLLARINTAGSHSAAIVTGSPGKAGIAFGTAQKVIKQFGRAFLGLILSTTEIVCVSPPNKCCSLQFQCKRACPFNTYALALSTLTLLPLPLQAWASPPSPCC